MSNEEYFSCINIETFRLYLNKRCDNDEKPIRFCCEPLTDIPGQGFLDSAEDTIKNAVNLRAEIIAENKKISFSEDANNTERILTTACAKCVHYKVNNWNSEELIHFVDLGMYPAPCQCKCIYCGILRLNEDMPNYKRHLADHEKAYNIAEYITDKGIVAADAGWKLSSGEITINPYKDRILKIVRNRNVKILTNCFIYDDDIASIISKNTQAELNLSIDAGTPETWYKVKRVDNFNIIVENLKKYSSVSINPEQITLKYIIIPGVNDNEDDYFSLIEIMRYIDIKHLIISRDIRYRYIEDKQRLDTLITAAGKLTAILQYHGITIETFSYSIREKELILSSARMF